MKENNKLKVIREAKAAPLELKQNRKQSIRMTM